MAGEYGIDCSTFVGGKADLDPRFATIDTTLLVAEACARRLITPRGSLIGDPEYGFDLREFLGARITNVTRARIIAGVEAECRKDERVDSARVVQAQLPTAADSRLTLRVAIVVSAETLQFVLSVDRLTAEVLING